jgi:hypothetical protein
LSHPVEIRAGSKHKKSMIHNLPTDVHTITFGKNENEKPPGTGSATRVPGKSHSKRNSATCSRNMGMHVLRTISEYPRLRKQESKEPILVQPIKMKAQRN